jgi:hypothetical protein
VLVPLDTPVTTPEVELTVAEVLLLLHVPPVAPALNVNAEVEVPVIASVPVIAGVTLSVTTRVPVQPPTL